MTSFWFGRTFGARVVAFGAVLGAGSVALAGPDWVENGDAGSNVRGAQRVLGVGQIQSIQGDLASGVAFPDTEDMYLVRILEPDTFFFQITAPYDTSLFLFNVSRADEAFGLLANRGDGKSFNPYLGPFSTDGTEARVTEPGVYALAIVLADRVPVSRTGEIFRFDFPAETSGADGVGGINPHEGWTGSLRSPGGRYNVVIEGGGFVDVPAPGAITLAVLGGLVAARRRR
ncbi:MAG: hypothetical protein SFZ23_04545 [Planctomycetota bacterium]|nr:hypothetical protein [Planctomycetota bacterium]